jgi:hypothetical protein
VLLAHLGNQPLAGKCVTEMLSKNQELQETKITTREIAIFVGKLRSSKMNPMYLQLLQACCSCEGKGVDGNQCKVVDMIFENTNDIIIQINADYTKVVPVSWASSSSHLYIPAAPIQGSPIKGEGLLYNGLPSLSLAWTTNSIDFSPLGLFGKLSVNVQELYSAFGTSPSGPSGPGGAMTKADKFKQTSNTQRNAVAGYFVSQMYLAAEMCMDRNYVAMHRLDELFPFNVLMTVLKINVSDELKAAAARLLLCLHVDRDPQAGTKVPVLTRTWAEIQKYDEPKLPYVEPQRQYMFCLLQQILSEHVEGMADRRWNQLSKRMLHLLKMMVSFNFYGTIDRMNDVIKPLVKAIDRRRLLFNESDGGGDGGGGGEAVSTKDGAAMSAKVKPESSKSASVKSNKVVPVDSAAKYAISDGGEEMKDGGEEDGDLPEGDVEIDEEQEEKLANDTWYGMTFSFMEGIPFLLFILTLVALAVTMTVLSSTGTVSDAEGTPSYYIGLTIFVIFVVDLCLRSYCYYRIHGRLYGFYTNTFNQIDFVVVAIDIVFLAMPDTGDEGGNAQYTKTLRLIRMVRLLRILRAARVVSALADLSTAPKGTYKEPRRYTKAPDYELETMSEMVDILLYAEKVTQDRNLSMFLRAFYLWENGDDERTPSEIYYSVVEKSSELTISSSSFDDIFLDVLMFKHTELVQGALDALMLRYGTQRTLLENAEVTQLLIAPKRERQFRLVDQMLQQLERNAETHELWGELESDADFNVNKQTKDILVELAEMCRSVSFVFDSRGPHKPEREVQDLLRNLDCYNICLKILELFDGVEEDEETGDLDEVGLNTKDLCRLCNTLLYWSILDNPKNQEQAYGSLEFFMETLDQDIGSDKCIRAVFSNNEYLMKLVPHIHLEELVDKIVQGGPDGKRHEFLSLAVSITNVGDRNVVENQFEIVRTLTKPGRLQKCGSFLVPVNHPEYSRKIALMDGLDVNADFSISELPKELGYHLTLMEVLAGCTAGRLNVSSIEAKIQSVFSYIDVIQTILDPRMVLIAKVETMRFLLNAIIEVELVVPGLGYSKCCWRLLTSFIGTLGSMKDDLTRVDQHGWGAQGVSRQKIEYQQLAIAILAIFFEKNYNVNQFTNDISNSDGQLDRVSMTASQASNIIKSLYEILRGLHKLNSPRLDTQTKDYLRRACLAMNGSVPNKIEYKETEDGSHLHLDEIMTREETEWAKWTESEGTEKDVSLEKRVHRKYAAFLQEIRDDEEIKESVDGEVKAFVAALEGLPYVEDEVKHDIRYETLIKKLVAHVRENITIIDGETRLPPRCSRTTLWVIKIFRTMIENKMEMSIFDRDEDGGEEQDIAAEPVVTAFNKNGVTELCLDLIADGVDDELQDEAIKLCVGLLYKEGGSRAVQSLMNNHLKRADAHLFWNQTRNIITKLREWHEWRVGDELPEVEEGGDPDIPVSLLLVRMLQLMSEGHYFDNQEIVREQPNSPAPVNILEDLVQYLKVLSQIPCRTSVVAALRVANTILEVLQGPCKKNQEYLAMSTDLLEVINRIIRSVVTHDIDVDELVELKCTVIDIIEGVLEAQSLKSPLYERVLSVLHVDAIVGIAFPDDVDPEEKEGTGVNDLMESEGWEILQTECVVILQMLIEYHPPLREELNIPEDVTDGTTTASVEILWGGEMNRVFFHIPDVCHLLSKPSKDNMVESVDRTSQELKLLDFLDRAAVLYREVKHQEKIVEWNLAAVFSRENQNYMTWAAFALAMTQNMLFLCYYDRQRAGDVISDDYWVESTTGPVMPPNIVVVVNVLNYCQIFCATFINVMMFVVRSPVIFQTHTEDGHSAVQSLIYTIADPTTMYYIIYNIIAVLGLTVEDYFSTLLLLDIIMKNSTAQNVLMAVVVPRWNIIMALIVTVFVCYIFGFYVFIYFPTEDFDQMFLCEDLWGCTKFLIDYGILTGEGIGEAMLHTVGQRWLLDTLAFFAITTGIFNLVAGVIITTFTQLREAKEARLENTTEVCFICGIDKHVFDRAANDPDGFKFHIGEDHNMWNYLYFIFFIWEQDKDDDDGLEYFVRYAIEASNIDWIPTNKAMRLDQAASEEEALQNDLEKATQASFHNVSMHIGKLEANVGVVLEQLTQTLKKDHHVEDEEGLGAAAAPIQRPRTTGPKATGEVSAPSSAWNVHRMKTAPYTRPETSGFFQPDGPTEEGSLASYTAGTDGNDMISHKIDEDDMTIGTTLSMLPASLSGRSDHCAIKKIYLEVVQCSNLPFLDASNFQGAKICVTGVMHGLLMDNGVGAAGEAKSGEAMDKEWIQSIAWYVFCYTTVLRSFLVFDGLFVSLIHQLLPACIL